MIPVNRRFAFAQMFAIMVLMGASNSVLFVILPLLSRQLGTGEMYVGFIFAGSAAFYMLFSPFWGWRSDTMGRRPVLLLGILGNTLSLLAMGLVAAWIGRGGASAGIALIFLALARVFYGGIGSAIQPAAGAYIADRTQRAERTALMAMLTGGAGLGTAIGPSLAAVLSVHFGVPKTMYVLVALSVLFFMLVAIALPEHQRPRQHKVQGRSMLYLITDPTLRWLLVIGTLSWMSYGVLLQTLLFHVSDQLHIAEKEAMALAGSILTLGALGILIVQFVLIPWFKLGPKHLMVIGGMLGAMGAFLMIFAHTPVLIGLAFIVASSGFGMLRPGLSSAASLRVGEQEQGAVAGLIGATAGAGFVLAPLTGLALYQFFGPSAAYGLLVFSLGGVCILALFQPGDAAGSTDLGC